MKRSSLNLLALFAVSLLLLSACSSRRGPATSGPDSSNSSGASATASPTETAQPQSQSPSQSTAASQATRSGWWVRINPAMTTAQMITFQIGTSKLQREEWRVWRTGEPAEFDVPEKYLQSPRLYLRGNVTPIGKLATLCMMYKDRGVEHMSFDDDDSETKSQAEIDIKCR